MAAALGAVVALAACTGSDQGGGAATPQATGQAIESVPPAVTASSPAAQSGAPTSHYVLMCSPATVASGFTGQLTWIDPTTLQVLYQETITPPQNTPYIASPADAGNTGFVPTPAPAATADIPSIDVSPGDGCGSWQLSADDTSIVGLDVKDNSVVPATYNLTTGAVTDIVQPPGTSGFAATTPVTYVGAYYAPNGKSVWSLQCDTSDNDLTLHAPNGTVEANIPSTVTPPGQGYSPDGYYYCSGDNTSMVDPYLLWLPGAVTPTIFGQNGDTVPTTAGGTSTPMTAAQVASLSLLDPSVLPKSNWTFTYIHRSPDGSQAAFIAQNNNTQAWALFTVDGAGKTTPQQVNGMLPDCSTTCGDVLAYNP